MPERGLLDLTDAVADVAGELRALTGELRALAADIDGRKQGT